MSNTTDNRTLAAQHADSLIETIRTRTDAGYPFGVRRNDSDEVFQFDDADAPALDSDEFADEWCEAGAIDYLSDVLNIHYMVNSDRTYRSARILISFGGPNVWIDTRTRELEVHWAGSEYRHLPGAFIDGLDDALSELWEMTA